MAAKLGFLKGKYLPLSYAQTYMYGCDWKEKSQTGLRVRLIKDKVSSDGKWVRLYAGTKRVWDCNYIFFKENFTKVVSVAPPKCTKELLEDGSCGCGF